MTDVATDSTTSTRSTPLRIGMLGASRESAHFARALTAAGLGSVTHFARQGGYTDARAPHDADAVDSLDALLDSGVDGVIIASPTADHPAQAAAALERGIPVFCQRPLGRNSAETRHVIDTARRTNVLLGVDMRFRLTEAMRELRSTVQAGELGEIYTVDAVFHMAGAPEDRWERDPQIAGGGCMLDCGWTMIDLALWTLGFPRVTAVRSRLFSLGEALDARRPRDVAEDFTTAMLDLDTGAVLRLSCGWHVAVGKNAHIELTFHGTEGGGSFVDVDGSGTRFASQLFRGTHRHALATSANDWPGRTIVAWASAIARGSGYDPWVEGVADVADAVDRILDAP